MPGAEERLATAEPAAPTIAKPVDAAPATTKSDKYQGPGGGSTEAAHDAFSHYCDDGAMVKKPAPADSDAAAMEAAMAEEEANIADEKAMEAAMVAEEAKLAADKAADEEAKELAKLIASTGKGDGWTSDINLWGTDKPEAGYLEQDQFERRLENMTPEMRAMVLEKMGKLEGDDALSPEAMKNATETAKDIKESEEAEERYQKNVTKKVENVEAAAKSGDTKAIAAQIDSMGAAARRDAMEKMSPEAKAAFEDELAKRRERLEKLAVKLEAAQHGKGALDATDEIGIVGGLTGLSPREADELQDIYGEKFKDGKKSRSLKADLKGEFGKDSKEAKYITAVLDGDEEADEMGVDLTVDYLADEANATLNADESGMNDLLRAHAKSKKGAARVAERYKEKTGNDLTGAAKKVMDDTELKELTAYERDDLRSANVAVIESGDGERQEMVIEEVKEEKGGLDQLMSDTREHTGNDNFTEHLDIAEDKKQELQAQSDDNAKKIKEERDAKRQKALDELKADKDPKKFAEAQHKARDVAGKLVTELGKGHYVGNNFDVTQHLVGLSEAEVALVMESYADQIKTAKLENSDLKGDLETDLRGKLKGKDLKVADSVLEGNKVRTAVALVEQAGDGAFTDVDAAKKAMATLEKPEDRKAFLEMMNKHVGGTKDNDAFTSWVKSETSSFERDELQAMGIVDEDQRAAKMAQVEISKNANAGKYAQMMEGLHDEIGDMRGETEGDRAKRRQMMRENDVMIGLSNLGGGNEDAMVDATARMKNERQLELLNENLKEADGKDLKQTAREELSQGRQDAMETFADGDFEGGQAIAMVAAVDDMQLNDNEDRASLAFEQVRVSDSKLKEISKIKDPKERDAALEAAKKESRESLLAKADEAAKKAGHESYMALLEKQLSPTELKAAKERIADGKISEVTQLLKAGDTTVGNLGKETGKFYEILGNKTPAEMKEFEKKFEAENPGVNFKEWVQSKAGSEGEGRDFAIMLEGNYARETDDELKKRDPRDLIKRVKDYGDAARGGTKDRDFDPIGNLQREVGNELGNDMADAYGNAGERVDHRVAAVKKFEEKLDAGEQLTPEEQDELIKHMRYMSGDQTAYTETKNQVVNASAEVAGTITEYGTVALTGSDTAGAFVGGATKMSVKSNLNAARYSGDEMVADVFEIGGDVIGSKVGGKFKNPLVSAGAEGMIGGVAQTLGDTKNYNDAGRALESGTKNVTEGGVTAVVGAGMEDVLGDGVVSKIAQAGADELITGDMSQSGGERLANVGKSAARDVAMSHAEKSHKKRNPDAPTIEARDATDEERREVDAAVAEENDSFIDVEDNGGVKPEAEGDKDNGVGIHPIVAVEGDNTPVDSGVGTHPIVAVEGDNTPVDSGVEVRPEREIEADRVPADATPADADAKARELPAPPATQNEDGDNDRPPPSSDAPATADATEPRRDAPRTLADIQALRPDNQVADPQMLADAKRKLAQKDGAAQLSDGELGAVFDLVVETARAGITAEGFDTSKNEELGGACGMAQELSVTMLKDVFGDGAKVSAISTHADHSLDDSDLRTGKDGTNHHASTVTLPDGRVVAFDVSFGQFAGEGNTAVVERLLQQEGGAEVAASLMQKGYVVLDDKAARAYAIALTGKETRADGTPFTAEDFKAGNRREGARTPKMRDGTKVLADGRQRWADVQASSDSSSDAQAAPPAAQADGGGDGDRPPPSSDAPASTEDAKPRVPRPDPDPTRPGVWMKDATPEERAEVDAAMTEGEIEANEATAEERAEVDAAIEESSVDAREATPMEQADAERAAREAQLAESDRVDDSVFEAKGEVPSLGPVDLGKTPSMVERATSWLFEKIGQLDGSEAAKKREQVDQATDDVTRQRPEAAEPGPLGKVLKDASDVLTLARGGVELLRPNKDRDPKAMGKAGVKALIKGAEALAPDLGPVFEQGDLGIKTYVPDYDEQLGTIVHDFSEGRTAEGREKLRGLIAIGTGHLGEQRPPDMTRHEDAINARRRDIKKRAKQNGETMPHYELEAEARQQALDDIQDRPGDPVESDGQVDLSTGEPGRNRRIAEAERDVESLELQLKLAENDEDPALREDLARQLEDARRRQADASRPLPDPDDVTYEIAKDENVDAARERVEGVMRRIDRLRAVEAVSKHDPETLALVEAEIELNLQRFLKETTKLHDHEAARLGEHDVQAHEQHLAWLKQRQNEHVQQTGKLDPETQAEIERLQPKVRVAVPSDQKPEAELTAAEREARKKRQEAAEGEQPMKAIEEDPMIPVTVEQPNGESNTGADDTAAESEDAAVKEAAEAERRDPSRTRRRR